MKFKIFFLFYTIIYSLNAQILNEIQVAEGKVVRHINLNSKFVNSRNIDVWLPKNYSKQKKYAVLYMQDGQMLFDSTNSWNKQEWGIDEAISDLLKQKKIRNCIVVGIWNDSKNRHIDYFPQKPFESLSKSEQDTLLQLNRTNGSLIFSGKIQSDNYLKFLVTELKPFIDSTYQTKKDVSNTFIGGSSMGALISIYAICEYPNIFGGALCLSTHWPGIFRTENNEFPLAMQKYLEHKLPNPKNHRIYFDYGTLTLDNMYEPYQLKVDHILKLKGYSTKNWITKKFVGENHSEISWSKRVKIPLEFILRK
ncbi:MAG: esterase [Bacteroidia bacterium]|nr:esterase [Bacteroidia bacterium]